jgi:hypothetical protein
MRICDSCIMALEDEGFGELEEDVGLLLTTLGADIADHLCDAIESDGEIECRCACKRVQKTKIRKVIR